MKDFTEGELFPKHFQREVERRFVGSRALDLARKALLSGNGISTGPGEITWDCSGDCSNSISVYEHEVATDMFAAVKVEAAARKAAAWMVTVLNESDIAADMDDVIIRHRPRAIGIRLSICVRCRKCDKCLDNRRKRWAWRAVSEWEAAERTWFGTLTLRPAAHEHFMNVARRDCDVALNPFEALSDAEGLLARHRAISPELTKWLKRVRKNSQANLRYLLVMEAHKSGLPHYHCLVHECAGSVQYRHLSDAWSLGHTKFNLVCERRQATYACKYLSKSATARLRASQDYGSYLPKQAISIQSESVKNKDYQSGPAPAYHMGPHACVGGNHAVDGSRAPALGRYEGT